MQDKYIKLTITDPALPNEIYGEMQEWSEIQERTGDLPHILAIMLSKINYKFPNGYKIAKMEIGVVGDKP